MGTTFMGSQLNPFSRTNRALVNIVILCTGVFILTAIIGLFSGGDLFLNYFKITPDLGTFIYQPFSLVTYIFMHADFWHLFSNMLWLFFIGVILEDLTGKKHIWRLFLGGGIAGGLLFMLLYNILPYFSRMPHPPYMVGASAGVTAVVVGTAAFVPRYRVFLFGIIGIELFWIAFFRVLFDFLGVAGPFNQGGYMAHLGGAAFGFFYIMHVKGTIVIPFIDSIGSWFRRLGSAKKTRPARTAKVKINISGSPGTTKRSPGQDEIDRILDKINKSGYDSLSKEEKETLFRAGDS